MSSLDIESFVDVVQPEYEVKKLGPIAALPPRSPATSPVSGQQPVRPSQGVTLPHAGILLARGTSLFRHLYGSRALSALVSAMMN